MNDTATALRRRIARAGQARDMLSDPLMVAIMDGMEKDAVNLWQMAIGPQNLGERERQHAAVCGIHEIRNRLRAVIEDGDLAQAQLDDLDEGE